MKLLSSFFTAFLMGLTPLRLLSIILIAALPILLITALNALFFTGIPVNVTTYLAALFLYYVLKPKVYMPAPMVLSLGLDKIPNMSGMPTSRPKPSHLSIVKSDDQDPPKVQ